MAGAVAVLVAVAVADPGPLVRLDQRVVSAANGWVAPRAWSVTVLEVVTFPGGRVPLVVLAGVGAGLLWGPGRGRRVGFALAASLTAGPLVSLTKRLVDRDRPEVDVVVGEAAGRSFPSGHALETTVVLGALLVAGLPFLARRARGPLVAATTLVVLAIGASRVLLGVHFPTDVVVGHVVGLGWLALWAAVFGVGPARRADDGSAGAGGRTASVGPDRTDPATSGTGPAGV